MKSIDDYIEKSESDPEEDKRIGSNVRFLRQERGFTQAQLAEEMQKAGQDHWYQTTVSRVERGSQSLTSAEVLALNEVLGSGVMHGTDFDATMKNLTNNLLSKAVTDRIAYIEQGMTEIQRVFNEIQELLGKTGQESHGDD